MRTSLLPWKSCSEIVLPERAGSEKSGAVEPALKGAEGVVSSAIGRSSGRGGYQNSGDEAVAVARGGDELLHAPRVLQVHQESEDFAVCEEDLERLHAREDRPDEVANRRRALRELALDLPDAEAIPPVERLAMRGPVHDRRAVPREERGVPRREV